jgi:hypothetical protein
LVVARLYGVVGRSSLAVGKGRNAHFPAALFEFIGMLGISGVDDFVDGQRRTTKDQRRIQYFLSTPITRPWISTFDACLMIGCMAAFDGCNRMLSPSR